MTEEQLAIRAGAGDNAAFDELARRLKRPVWAIAAKYYAPGLERDDLRQAALVGLWKGCRTYRPELLPAGARFEAFAAMCVHRNLQTSIVTANRLKQRVLHEALSLDAPARDDIDVGDLHEVVPSSQLSALEQIDERERIRALVDAIAGLTELERESLVGFVFRGESYLEIEQRFLDIERAPGEKAKIVDNAIERARRKLRVVLAEGSREPPFRGRSVKVQLRDRSARGLSLGAAQPVALGPRTEGAAFTGKSAAEMKAEHQAFLDEQPTVTSCAFCEWTYAGPAAIGRDAARQHREAKHPEATVRRSRRRGAPIGKWRDHSGDAKEQIKIETAEANRDRQEREDAERLAKIERGRGRAAIGPELEETAAVGDPVDSGSAEPRREPERAASSSPGASTSIEGETMQTVAERLGLKKFGRGYIWTREAMIEAVKAWHAEHGESPGWDASKRSPIGTLPNGEKAKEEFGGWAALLEAAGLPPTQTGPKSSDRAERPAPAPRPESSRPTPETPEPSQEIEIVEPLRDPIRTADIPYDADILEDEARFLRERADALDAIAAGVRQLARASRRDDLEEELAA